MTLQPRFSPTSTDLVFRPSSWDASTDEAVVAHILSDRPIVSPKNIWAFWHSGWDGMRPWRRRNIISWARRHDTSWEIRVLDLVPGSPRHILNFLSKELLPDALIENQMDPLYRNTAQHVSDMIRLPLLFEHGGVWLDVGLFTLHDLDKICWDAICDVNDPTEFCCALQPMTATHSFPLNGFLASLPGSKFLKLWHSVFLELWKGKTSCVGMSTHPLLIEFPQWQINEVIQAALGQDVTLAIYNDYLAQTLACVRVLSLIDPESGFSGPDFWNRHCRFYSIHQIYPLHEIFRGSEGYSEQRQYGLFKLPRVVPQTEVDPEQRDAQRFVEETLRSSALKKLTHGPCTAPTVASLWNVDDAADAAPGTWGEYFRWGTVHLVSKIEPQICNPGDPGIQRFESGYKLGATEVKDLGETEIIYIN